MLTRHTNDNPDENVMEIDNETRQEIVDLIFQGRKIEAIKVYRELSGAGLSEAKTFVEALTNRLAEEHPERVPPRGQGCGSAVLLVLVLAGTLTWILR